MLTTGWPIYFTSGCWLYFCDQLRELFNAEITRFRDAWDLPMPPLAG